MTDQELIAAFENCSLPAENFHHADHVRVAFLYLCQFPILEAIPRFSMALRRFAASLGKPTLYHETITWAFLFLIRERLVLQSSDVSGRPPSWEEFKAHNPDLLNQKSNSILREYYADETLGSELAKRLFVLPDRAISSRTTEREQ